MHKKSLTSINSGASITNIVAMHKEFNCFIWRNLGMYDDLMKGVKEKMQPAIDVAEVNKKALETLFSLQSEYVTDFVDSSVSQMKALSEAKEPTAVFELQIAFFKELETKMTNIAEKELEALTSAREEISSIVEKSMSDIDAPYMTDLTKIMSAATEAKTSAAPAKKAPAKKAPAKKAPAKRKPAASK